MNKKNTSSKEVGVKLKNNHISVLRLTIKQQTFFAKRLSFLLKAGIPLVESLRMLEEQTFSKKYAKILKLITESVSGGQTLSASLSKFRGMFGSFAINIISVGEMTGILSENLDYLAEELKKKHSLRKKLIGSFIYPALIAVATLGITSFLMIYLFPKLMPVFNSLKVELPISTRTVIWLSDFLRHYGFYLVIVLIFLVIIFIISLNKSKGFHLFIDRTILRIPLVGTIVQYYNLANLSRTLGLLLKGGMTPSEAIPITAKTTNNRVYRREIMALSHTVNRGEKISSHFKNDAKLFPEILGQIVSVGERSGNLPDSLIYLSDLYENEVDDFTKNLSSLIEPVLMIIMGIVVGFIAISIISPIYGITQNLQVN
ncbi:MAG: hypothetical protein CO184_00270 [Candidatus Zambryskibacteria bacterium CG_4_9_14_3_um_filter_40_16]|uniref:Type II secretion system protein GspF domain-containing protein n=2 Tax=Candidatus Zambryskiibacteriota TaxID=1817925 RepID=A0A2M7WVE8_9BACT|nr:MAG: hypothetical protein CO184_00270 [Candidatus Zambryskibacteria bacterium CG_4_9_14_3_um_filter_40_16]